MRGTQRLLRDQYLHNLGLVDTWVGKVAEDTPSYTLVPGYKEVASNLEKSGRGRHIQTRRQVQLGPELMNGGLETREGVCLRKVLGSLNRKN